MHPILPPRLRPGDLIALIAPASTPPNQERINGGVAYLERRGYRVVVGKHVTDVHGYLAGTDDARLEDLNEFIRNPDVRGIFAIRGGYGTPRILDGVDYGALRRDPKVFVGYSDLTALQLAIFARTTMVTFSGPMAGVEMWKEIDPFTESHFWDMVEGISERIVLRNPTDHPVRVLRGGTAEGTLIGGNLSLLQCLIGTQYLPALHGTVMAIEDVDEAPHRVDRMLAQLKNAGALHDAAAVLYGQFTDCVPSDPTKPFLSIDQVLEDYVSAIHGPVLKDMMFGHIPQKFTLPLGVRVRVDGDKGEVEVLEKVVRENK
ncbi:MAG: LD-carboxypeptidase [Bacteroidetes bacterium]|jgi:muramoyltetrapeptide carboxypeptidase|nr:LD-carboxypeptidase [Bacteroidota bacterium]